MKTIRLAVVTALLVVGLGACTSVERIVTKTDTGIREDIILTSPFHILGLADRDVTTMLNCNPACQQMLDNLPAVVSPEQKPLSFNAYPVGEKQTLSDGKIFQHFETWDKPVEILGMEMPTVFGALCEPNQSSPNQKSCVLTIPNKDEGTFGTRRTVIAGAIVVIWWNPFGSSGTVTVKGAPAAGGPGGPGGPI